MTDFEKRSPGVFNCAVGRYSLVRKQRQIPPDAFREIAQTIIRHGRLKLDSIASAFLRPLIRIFRASSGRRIVRIVDILSVPRKIVSDGQFESRRREYTRPSLVLSSLVSLSVASPVFGQTQENDWGEHWYERKCTAVLEGARTANVRDAGFPRRTDCEAERERRMTAAFWEHRFDSAKANPESVAIYKEGPIPFLMVLYRDGRVEFTGRPKKEGVWGAGPLATYYSTIHVADVNELNERAKRAGFFRAGYGPRKTWTTHSTGFTFAMRHYSGTWRQFDDIPFLGREVPEEVMTIARAMLLATKLTDYSCSAVEKISAAAPC